VNSAIASSLKERRAEHRQKRARFVMPDLSMESAAHSKARRQISDEINGEKAT